MKSPQQHKRVLNNVKVGKGEEDGRSGQNGKCLQEQMSWAPLYPETFGRRCFTNEVVSGSQQPWKHARL